MIYIPSFKKIGLAIQKLIRGYTQTAWSHKPNFIFLKYGKYAKNRLECKYILQGYSIDYEIKQFLHEDGSFCPLYWSKSISLDYRFALTCR
jgi:hypothetical protein